MLVCVYEALRDSLDFIVLSFEDAGFKVVLANAREVNNRTAGRKTDVSDSEWLAQLVRSGLL
jgi:hypothetical protein